MPGKLPLLRRWPLLVALAVLPLARAGSAVAPPPAPPALVVVLTIDQFRADYLARFREFFVPGGFRLLMENGATFSDCRYRHAVSKTACGHAVVLTGVHADVHGIINNGWVDRASLKRVNCIDDDRVQILGRADDRGGGRLPAGVLPLGHDVCSPRPSATN